MSIRYRGTRRLIRFLGPARCLRFLMRLLSRLEWIIDRASIHYEDGVHVKHRLTRYHDFFVERIKTDDDVIDLGCGVGALAASVAERCGAAVTGLDISAGNLAHASSRFNIDRLRFIEGDIYEYAPGRTYDVVILSNVLEHLDGRPGLLRSLGERIQPRQWLIRVPMSTRHWHVPLRRELGLPWMSDSTHYTEYTEESLQVELAEADLKILELRAEWGELYVSAVPLGTRREEP